MRLILEDCREWMESHTDASWMGSPQMCESFACAPELPPSGFVDLAFVDDAAIALHAQSIEQLQNLVQHSAMAMHHAAKKRGMTLNFDKNKTEVLWHIMGRGSRKTRLELAEQGNILKWEHGEETFALCVSQSYRHLGTWLQAPPRCARDIQHRASLAKSSWGSLSRPLYAKSYVSMKAKTEAFQALSMSRLMYNVHTWCFATDDDWQRWQNHMRKPVGLLVKHTLMGQPPTHVETADLFGMADMLTPIQQLHLARLWYLKRLLKYCPQVLCTFLFHSRSAQGSSVIPHP